MIIAVDGPAASGKGTIAKALAEHYGLPHLDTGLLYRAVAIGVMRSGGDPSDPEAALPATEFPVDLLNDPELRAEQTGVVASLVSVHPQVRKAIFQQQRDFVGKPGGAVVDGRDIGTVIAPEADVKLFVTASPEIRAGRRHLDELESNPDADFDAILADIVERDRRDRERTTSPLIPADDADLLDTSDLTIEAAVQRAIALVEARTGKR